MYSITEQQSFAIPTTNLAIVKSQTPVVNTVAMLPKNPTTFAPEKEQNVS